MRVLPDEKGPVDLLFLPVFADGLRNREDVRFVEGAVGRRPAVSARAEADALGGVFRVRLTAM
jgi:hypothetical protein